VRASGWCMEQQDFAGTGPSPQPSPQRGEGARKLSKERAMDNSLIPAYINATAALLALPLDAARTERVAEHLQRTAAMAALLEGADLAPHDELAEIYSPLAFPSNNHGRNQL
jgi:hypothetical protein